MSRKIKIFDTTLRDGTQGENINFTADDKLKIARRLDELGIHYIEGGWPGSNPKDAEFFARQGELNLKKAKIAAFGSTRYKGTTCDTDGNIQALVAANPLGNKTMFASVFQDNPASARVLTHCGFEYIGDTESCSVARNATGNTWTYLKRMG